MLYKIFYYVMTEYKSLQWIISAQPKDFYKLEINGLISITNSPFSLLYSFEYNFSTLPILCTQSFDLFYLKLWNINACDICSYKLCADNTITLKICRSVQF